MFKDKRVLSKATNCFEASSPLYDRCVRCPESLLAHIVGINVLVNKHLNRRHNDKNIFAMSSVVNLIISSLTIKNGFRIPV